MSCLSCLSVCSSVRQSDGMGLPRRKEKLPGNERTTPHTQSQSKTKSGMENLFPLSHQQDIMYHYIIHTYIHTY